LRGADGTDVPLDDAVGGMGVHARPGGPALAVDFELGLLGVVAEQRELLEVRIEAGGAEGIGDRSGGSGCLGGAGGADADRGPKRLHEAHGPSLSSPGWTGRSSRSEDRFPGSTDRSTSFSST